MIQQLVLRRGEKSQECYVESLGGINSQFMLPSILYVKMDVMHLWMYPNLLQIVICYTLPRGFTLFVWSHVSTLKFVTFGRKPGDCLFTFKA